MLFLDAARHGQQGIGTDQLEIEWEDNQSNRALCAEPNNGPMELVLNYGQRKVT